MNNLSTSFLAIDDPMVAVLVLGYSFIVGQLIYSALIKRRFNPRFFRILFGIMFLYNTLIGVSTFRSAKSLDMFGTTFACGSNTTFENPRTLCTGYSEACYCDIETGEILHPQVIQEISTRSAYLTPTTAPCSSDNLKVCAFADKTINEQWYDMGIGTILSGLLFGLIGVWLPSKSNKQTG
jgi:hypothetical protein